LSKSPTDCLVALAGRIGDAYFYINTDQGKIMTDFKDRENAFEAKFARDEEMQFRVTARRNRLLGQWAAEKMGLTSEETDAYAKEVVAADFEEAGDEDVVRKLLGDLTSAGVEIDDSAIRTALSDKMVEARRQFIEEAS
tara:strand:+ start:931 stop:1347 length:417 start_codon:yes stop_codon:yes gene_type:complete